MDYDNCNFQPIILFNYSNINDEFCGSIMFSYQFYNQYGDGYETVISHSGDVSINEGNSVLDFYDNNFCSIISISGNMTMHITGMFEDEGVGIEGDLNDDESVDVIDVVTLVNIIIDGE